MIEREELVKIGIINKTHGLQGELSFSFTNDWFDREKETFLILETDGIFVPFLLDDYRFQTNDKALIKLRGVDSEPEARPLVKREVYFLIDELEPEEIDEEQKPLDYFVGFDVFDQTKQLVGKIVEVNDATENVLFVLRIKEGEEIFIPATDDYILSIDEELQTLHMEIPEGLLSIND